MLATLGLGTAWLGGVAVLATPHRPLLLTVAAACLASAAILMWRQRAAVCVPGAFCPHPAIKRATVIGLLVGVVLLYLGYTYA
jgi:mercuric ion transport protein